MLKDWLRVTENPDEIRAMANRLVEEATVKHGEEKKKLYTPLMLSKMDEEIRYHVPNDKRSWL